MLHRFGYFQPVHGRHRDIEEYDIWLVFSYLAEGIGSVHRLANHFYVGVKAQDLAYAAADAFVVVHHQHTKCAHGHSSSTRCHV